MNKEKQTSFTDNDIVNDYTSGMGVNPICEKYHIGKLKVKSILKNAGVEIKKRGGQNVLKDTHTDTVKLSNDNRYPIVDGFHYIAVLRTDNSVKTLDYQNKAGVLTKYIKEHFNVESTLWERKKYFSSTGMQWWEQWFDIILEKNAETKKCPYCEWATIDIDNKSGMFETHLLKQHGLTKLSYLEKHPEDKKYFSLKNLTLNRQMETDNDKFIICLECGKKLSRIDGVHLKSHNLTKMQYMQKYGLIKTISNDCNTKLSILAHKMNLSLDGKTDKFTSKDETEIREFILGLGVQCTKNRSVLNGEELDLFIEEENIAIEYNGCKWHTEFFGHKNLNYHLLKTKKCEEKGIRLIHIMEDEYHNHKELVLEKLRYLLHKNNGEKIMARKCVIKEISQTESDQFLNKYHIQGEKTASVYYGAFYNNNLIAVCLFSKRQDNGEWELVRHATDFHFIVQGICGKFIHNFIQQYEPDKIISFADRRWSSPMSENLYSINGFLLDGIVKPSYTYYNEHIDRYHRIHKFNFRKQTLLKKYPDILNENMTETEMARTLGYDRIWDCGLLRYVWTKK